MEAVIDPNAQVFEATTRMLVYLSLRLHATREFGQITNTGTNTSRRLNGLSGWFGNSRSEVRIQQSYYYNMGI